MQPDSVAPLRRRVVFEDPDLPHQIVITKQKRGTAIAVSCNCLRGYSTRRGGGAFEPLAARSCFPAAEAMAVWREHMAGVESS